MHAQKKPRLLQSVRLMQRHKLQADALMLRPRCEVDDGIASPVKDLSELAAGGQNVL